MWFSIFAAAVAGHGGNVELSELPAVDAAAHAPFVSSQDESISAIPLRFAPDRTLNLSDFAESLRFGEKGSRRWQVHGAYIIQPDDVQNQASLVGLGVNTFIVNDLSLNAELNGLYVRQRGDDAIAANFNLLFQWHFYPREADDWSMYVDIGAGMLIATDRVPRDGSRFNFTPQMGGGLSFDLGNNTRLMTGLRWHHISNANLYADNPGRDSVMAYIGLSFGF